MRFSVLLGLAFVLALLAACRTPSPSAVPVAPAAGPAELADNQQLVRGAARPSLLNIPDPFVSQVETTLRPVWKSVSSDAPSAVEQILAPLADPAPQRYSNRLAAGHTYEAELPQGVRDGTLLVGLRYRGTADANPEKGPIISIDGLKLGFMITRDSRPATIEIAVGSVRNQRTRWQSLGMATPFGRGTVQASMPVLWVHLHASRKTADVYMGGNHHHPLMKDIPYQPDAQTNPVVRVSTMAGTDPAFVGNLVVVSAPGASRN